MSALGSYLRLYRADAAAISFLSFAAGVVLTRSPDLEDAIAGALICLVSFNFIYSINSWADSHIDAVNKPDRPLPAGRLRPRSALRYAVALGVLSCLWPVAFTRDPQVLGLLLTLPVLGVTYSVEPIRLRRYRLVSVAMIGVMFVTPMAIALAMGDAPTEPWHHILLAYFYVFSVSIIPLKDVGDRAGDRIDSSANWEERFGARRLQIFALVSMLLTGGAMALAPLPPVLKGSLVSISGALAALIAVFLVARLDPRRLYRTALVVIIVAGAVGVPLWSWMEGVY